MGLQRFVEFSDVTMMEDFKHFCYDSVRLTEDAQPLG